MTASQSNGGERRSCRLEWFINSRCDYACRGCVPETSARDKPDLDLGACRAALNSFVDFASQSRREARIEFYPRQAEFTKPFTAILSAVRDLKGRGLIKNITSVNRGDLPSRKIRLFRDNGVDVCRLTIDGPEAVQDKLRREGSFRDTLKAFREARDNGIRVEPMMILVEYNAPYLAETMRLALDEGFQDFAVKAGIRGDVGGADRKASVHPDPRSRWNRLLSPRGYRAVLAGALAFLDSLGPRHGGFRARFLLGTPMVARLFYELGRIREYERMAAGASREAVVPFLLKPGGSVLPQESLPAIGSFPGGSFQAMYESAHPLRWFERAGTLARYRARKQREFAKCRACPAAPFCPPLLVGARGPRLFYVPDVHCWVDAPAVPR